MATTEMEITDWSSSCTSSGIGSCTLTPTTPSPTESPLDTYFLFPPPPDSSKTVKRASSLRLGQTTEKESSHKKLVRFADCLGLDLVDVKTFILDSLPLIPPRAYVDLDLPPLEIISPPSSLLLLPTFPQPSTLPNFTDLLHTQKIKLASCTADSLTITGVIKVVNLSFEKAVYLRYSYNQWLDFGELQCTYAPHEHTPLIDTFSFCLPLPHPTTHPSPWTTFTFALRYTTPTQTYWDNNTTLNYTFHLL
ncbi:glycogen-binding subunit 76A-like [Folsomia candida]|uniref:glycogen-binding subunit 76A-like n=1 Tax=Folsomia candida TaxID=158441 RepID=UPI000B8F4665|nr:glycogen-binding subunit 76A-like [Folsomia candida]